MEEGQQGGAIEVEATEEATPVRIRDSPILPSESEIEKHRAEGHIPYWSWCSHCNNGQGARASIMQVTRRRGRLRLLQWIISMSLARRSTLRAS